MGAPLSLLALLLALVGAGWLVGQEGFGWNAGEGRAPQSEPARDAAAPPEVGAPGALPRSTAPTSGAPALRLDGRDAFSFRFATPPAAGLLFDLRTGRVLWRRNPTARRPIASLTKVMTALLVVERAGAREAVRVPRDVLFAEGSRLGVLKPGRRVAVESLLAALLVRSAADAAVALAAHVGRSRGRFVALMNARARRLGLRCTRFTSPDGLDPGNRSCPADLAALAKVAMRSGRIRRIVGRQEVRVPFPIPGGVIVVGTTNPLLAAGYAGTIGLKTGFTNRSGPSFIGVVRRGRRALGVVLLGSPSPGQQARDLLDRAFLGPRAPRSTPPPGARPPASPAAPAQPVEGPILKQP